jgi:DNA-binding CsgD family transcriptional regulator
MSAARATADPLALLASAVELVGLLRGRAEAEGVPAEAVDAVVASLVPPPGATSLAPLGPVPVPGSPEVLSAREVEVLALLAAGEPNRAIAGRLFISEHTVKTHVRHVLAKLGVGSRAHAVARARQLRII